MVKNCVSHISKPGETRKSFCHFRHYLLIYHYAWSWRPSFTLSHAKLFFLHSRFSFAASDETRERILRLIINSEPRAVLFQKGTRTLTLLLDETCLGCFNFWCLGLLSQDDKRRLSSRKCTWKWNSIRLPSVFHNLLKMFCIFWLLFAAETWQKNANKKTTATWKREKYIEC